MPRSDSSSAGRLAVWVLLLTAAALLVPGVFTHDFWIYNEGRRAIIALEMIQRGDWLVPHLMGQPILTKPPLFYWLVAAVNVLTGSATDWGARLPSVLAALLGVWALARLMTRLFDRETGFVTALMMTVCPVYVAMAQSAEPEMLFNSAGILGMACYGEWLTGGRRRRWIIGFYGCLLLAMMAKGPVVPLILLLTVAIHALLGGPRPALRVLCDWRGWAVLWLPILLYLALLEARGAGISAILHEVNAHLGEDAPHAESFGYYFNEWHKLLFPWPFWIAGAGLMALGTGWMTAERGRRTAALCGRFHDWLRQGRAERLLLGGWCAATFLCLSAIPSKRYYYGLILAPPVAAVAGMLYRDWRHAGAGRLGRLRERWGGALPAVIALAAAGLLVAAWLMPVPERWEALDGKSTLDGQTLLAVAGVWGFLCAGLLTRRRLTPPTLRRGIFSALLLSLAGMVTCYNFVLNPRLNALYSLKIATRAIEARLPPGATLFSYRSTHTVCFYLGRPDLPELRDPAALDAYTQAHPAAFGIADGDKWEDVTDTARYEVLYRSDYIPVKDAQVLLFRRRPER